MTDPTSYSPIAQDPTGNSNSIVAATEGGMKDWAEQITPGRYAGRTVVVTGAASGIGRATAFRVAREGGRVIAVDLLADRVANLVKELKDFDVVAVTGDITAQVDIDAVIAAVDGRIDALANVAGITDDFSPLHETTDAMWERVMAINLTGAFKLTRAVLPLMLKAHYGSVVNVASGAALRGGASGNAYTVSKHALIGLTRSAAFMYAPQGIRMNAVAPGAVATDIQSSSNLSEYGRARLAPFHALLPSIATAEAVAASITFLLSDDAVNINGAVLSTDGGWSAQ